MLVWFGKRFEVSFFLWTFEIRLWEQHLWSTMYPIDQTSKIINVEYSLVVRNYFVINLARSRHYSLLSEDPLKAINYDVSTIWFQKLHFECDAKGSEISFRTNFIVYENLFLKTVKLVQFLNTMKLVRDLIFRT